MSIEAIFLPIFIKVAGTLIATLVKNGISSISKIDEIQNAANKTGIFFEEYEGVEQGLLRWCKSQDFMGFLTDIEKDDFSLTSTEIVESYLKMSDFYVPIDIHLVATKILNTFAKSLEIEILKSKDGLVLVEARQKYRNSQILSEIENLKNNFLDVGNKLAASNSGFDYPSQLNGKSTQYDESHYDNQIDLIRDEILSAGQYRSSIKLLKKLRKEIVCLDNTDNLLFRIATNIGASYIELNDLPNTFKYFSEAHRLQPKNIKALSNLGLYYLVMGNLSKATDYIEKALKINDDDEGSLIVYLQILGQTNEWNKIDDIINSKNINRTNILLTLGAIFYHNEQYDKSYKYLRKAIILDEENPEAKKHLANCIVMSCYKKTYKDSPFPWVLPNEFKDKLREANDLYDEIKDYYQNRENSTHYKEILSNSSNVKIQLKEMEGSLRDCEKLLEIDSTDSFAISNKIKIYFFLGRHDEIINIFKSVDYIEEYIHLIPILVESCLSCKRNSIGIEILRDIKAKTSNDISKFECLISEATLLLDMGEANKANDIITELSKKPYKNERYFILRSQIEYKNKKFTEAERILKEGLEAAEESRKSIYFLFLGDLFLYTNKFADSAYFYEKVPFHWREGEIGEKYCISLLNSGDYRKVSLEFDKIKKAGWALTHVQKEIKAKLCEYTGDLNGALKIYNELLTTYPENDDYVLSTAFLYLQLNNFHDAKRLTSPLLSNPNIEPINLFLAGKILLICGDHTKGLETVYQARKACMDSAEIHTGYISAFLFMNRFPDDFFNVNAVKAETRVTLSNQDNEINYIITDDETIFAHMDEIKTQSNLAKKLIGKSKGDSIQISDKLGEPEEYIVSDIVSKYVYAFQQSIRNFDKWFPENNALKQINIKNNDFSTIFNQLTKRHDTGQRLKEAYLNKNLSINMFSELMGVSMIDVWHGMVLADDANIYCANGDRNEQEDSQFTINNSNEIVIGLIGLLTLDLLGDFELLFKAFRTVYIHQRILDVFDFHIKTLKSHKEDITYLVKSEDKFFIDKISKEQKESTIKKHQHLLNIIRDKCCIVPADEIVSLDKSIRKELETIIGLPLLSCIMISKSKNIPLLEDDLIVRQLGKSQFNIDSFCTENLLTHMIKIDKPNRQLYLDEKCQLIKYGYKYIGINEKLLMHSIEKSHYSLHNKTVRKVFSVIQDKGTSQDDATRIIALFLRQIWVDRLPIQTKCLILDFALSSLTKHRDSHIVIKNLKIRLKNEMQLVYQHQNELLAQIELWQNNTLI